MTLYVSWGGSGTSDSLRIAAQQAHDSETSLVYLGVVDDESSALAGAVCPLSDTNHHVARNPK